MVFPEVEKLPFKGGSGLPRSGVTHSTFDGHYFILCHAINQTLDVVMRFFGCILLYGNKGRNVIDLLSKCCEHGTILGLLEILFR